MFTIFLCFTVVITIFCYWKMLFVRNSQISIKPSKIIVLSNQDPIRMWNTSSKNSSNELIQLNLCDRACYPVKVRDHKEGILLNCHLLTVSDNLINYFWQSFRLADFYLIVKRGFGLLVFSYSDNIYLLLWMWIVSYIYSFGRNSLFLLKLWVAP